MAAPSATATFGDVPEGGLSAKRIASRRFWSTLALVVVLAITNGSLLAAGHQPLGPYGLFVASAILWVCAFPLWRFFHADRRTLAFIPAASALYAVYFALPALRDRPMFHLSLVEPVWSSVGIALNYALFGAVAMILGAYGTRRLLVRLPRIRRDVDFARAAPLLLITASVGLAMRVGLAGTRIPQLDMVFGATEQIGLVALGGLLIAGLRGQLGLWKALCSFAILSGVVAVGLTSGLLANAVFPVAGLVFVYCWERKRIPWMAILVGTLILAPFHLSKQEFRAQQWTSTDEIGRFSPGSMLKILENFFSMTVVGLENGHFSVDDMQEAGEGRTDELTTMAIVVDETPREIPYWGGYTYSALGWAIVPRLLVPDKPSLTIGQDFPRRYGLIDYNGYDTMYNLSQNIELYINFGLVGLGVGMFIMGLLYAALDHSFSASSGGAMIGSVIFGGLMNIESNFAQVWGGIPFMILAYYAFVRLLPRKPLVAPDELVAATSPS